MNALSNSRLLFMDGLRGLAVVFVLLYHIFPNQFPGGFLGVDIFFVLSGYFIASKIQTELDLNKFSLKNFYINRIFRIFPALIVLLILCIGFGYFSLLPHEFIGLGSSINDSSLFISNFRLWKDSGYFDIGSLQKPLLNLWSLSVEIQFYLIFPLLLVIVNYFKSKLILLFIFLFSLILNIYYSYYDSSYAFYLITTRLWEFLAGALLYIYNPVLSGIHKKVFFIQDNLLFNKFLNNKYLSFFALFILFLSLFIFDLSLINPGYFIILPVLAVCIIIYSCQSQVFIKVVLSNRFLCFFGAISYSLYLYHWPIFSFINIIEPQSLDIYLKLACIFLSIILAIISFFFIERPFIRLKKSSFALLLFLLILLISYFGSYISSHNGLTERSILKTINSPISRLGADNVDDHNICLQKNNLSNNLNIRYCRISGPNSPHIAIIGDSHAAGIFSPLSNLLLNRFNEGLLLIGGRLFIDVAAYPIGNIAEINTYKGGIEASLFVANNQSIDTVIMVSRGSYYFADNFNFFLINDPSIKNKREVYRLGLRSLLDLMLKKNKKVIFVLENPSLDKNPFSCIDDRPFRILKSDNDCLISKEKFLSEFKEYRELIFSVLKDYPTVMIFDPSLYLCDQYSCKGKIGGLVLYGDSNHLSYEGNLYISKYLLDLLITSNLISNKSSK